MQQLVSVWSALTPRRRVIVIAASVAMFAAVLALSRLAATPGMSLLYAGLEGPSAGAVVQALEQRGVAHEIRGDAIYVDTRQRDALRMTLAAEGLPASSLPGYEILDNLSGFATTAQMFDVAYWRAREGELARTILANPQVRAARVHLAPPQRQAFRPDGAPGASVTVTTRGGVLAPAQARAIRHLVASAVSGMRPEDVTVIDSSSGMVLARDETGPGPQAEDRAETLRRNAQRLLEARVGPGRSVVEVSLEMVMESESITERRFDPAGRVAISTETSERAANSTDSRNNNVTVASNLPDGDGAAGSTSRSTDTETRERVNFEVSETQRELLRAPGAIRRLSVAVLVDGVYSRDDAGIETWTPRSEAELADLHALVASAVGFDAARGDVITLKSLPFEPLPGDGSLAESPFPGGFDRMALIRLAVLAAVALILGLFVLRPLLQAKPAPHPAAIAPPAPAVLSGEIDDSRHADHARPVVSESFATERGHGTEPAAPDPVTRLRQLIAERQDETVEILRGWVEEQEGRT